MSSENKAIAAKNDALDQAQKRKISEQRAVAEKNRAEASALVAEATSLLNIDPEQSLQLALQSAPMASTPGLEDTLRDALMNAQARAVLPSGSGAVTAIEVSSSGASSAVLSSGNGTVDTLRTSADGMLVLVGGAEGEARVFELARNSVRRLARLRLGAPLRDAVFMPDGKSVFTGDANGVIIRWDVRSGARLARAVHGAPIRELAVSPDGSLVASAAGEAARVWRASDGGHVIRLPHPLSVEGVSFSSSGAQLLTLARDARLYDTRDWGRAPIVLDQPGQILTAVFSPAGDFVATGGRDDLAMIWDTRDGTRRQTLVHSGDVLDVAWSPNGALLATASADNGGRVFRTDTGALVHVPGRALEPGRRRRLQPGRRVDRDRVP